MPKVMKSARSPFTQWSSSFLSSASICWLPDISSINPSATESCAWVHARSFWKARSTCERAKGGYVFSGLGQAASETERRRAQSWQITVLYPLSSALVPALMVACPRAGCKSSSYNPQGPVVAPEVSWLMRVNNCMFHFLSMSHLYQRPLVLEGCWSSWSREEW